jgi:hypothetical protein
MDNYLEAAPIANRTAGVGASPPARGMRSPLRPPQLAPGPPQVTARLPPHPHPDLAASPSLLTATRPPDLLTASNRLMVSPAMERWREEKEWTKEEEGGSTAALSPDLGARGGGAEVYGSVLKGLAPRFLPQRQEAPARR